MTMRSAPSTPTAPAGAKPLSLTRFVTDGTGEGLSPKRAIAPQTMNATSASTLMRESQNSTSPNTSTPMRLTTVITTATTRAKTQMGTAVNHACRNVPAAIVSEAGPMRNAAQYVHPVAKPARGPSAWLAYSWNDPATGRLAAIS